MPRRARNPIDVSDDQIRSAPPTTQEARESQLISLAMDLVEQRLRDGTASSQEVVHYLRLGSKKDRLEREMMEARAELLNAKTEAIKAAERSEALYEEAIKAFRSYTPDGDDEEFYD